MAKSIKELKKENVFLKSKSEKSDGRHIELVEEVSLDCIFGFAYVELFQLVMSFGHLHGPSIRLLRGGTLG